MGSDWSLLAPPSPNDTMASDAAMTASSSARKRSQSAVTTTGRLLEKQAIELQHVVDDRDNLTQQLEDTKKELQAALKSTAKEVYEEKIKSLEMQVQKLRKSGEHAQKHSSSLEEALEARDRDIRQLQAEKLQSLESAQWAPLSSSDIKHEVDSVLSAIRYWSGDHSDISAERLAESQRTGRIHRRLIRLGCVSEDQRILKDIIANTTLQKPGKAAVFLLSTIASAFLLRHVLADPFFVLWDPSLHSEQGDCTGAVVHILNLIAKSDVEEAEALRCQLVRSLDKAFKQGQNQSRKLAKHIAGWFVEHYAAPFWNSSEAASSMSNGFLPIVEQVIQLAWQVWTRKARLEVLIHPDLSDQKLPPGCVVYSSSSDKLELHSMHNKVVDDDATALDGYLGRVLCSPTVVLAGNADGKEYNKKRVVRKGVVWLG